MRWQVAVAIGLAACAAETPYAEHLGAQRDASVQEGSSAADEAAEDPLAPVACSGKPVPRCDPAACPHCFEIVPGYAVCADAVLEHGTATSCSEAPQGYPAIAHQCCNDADCGGQARCMQGVSDAQTNFPPNTCVTPGLCAARSDCGAGEVCIPLLGYVLRSYCTLADCIESSECEPGYVCAPTWLDQPTGNHGESFAGVHCIPDPRTCVSPD